jgi:hypothetical protein
VNRKASNIASRDELGKFPLLIPTFKWLFSYINHLSQLPDTSIAKQTFYLSKRLYSKGKDSFFSNAASIIKKFHPNIEDTIDIEKFVQDTNITTL